MECQVSAKRKYLCLHATLKQHLEVIKVAFRRSLEPSSGTCVIIKFRDRVRKALFAWKKKKIKKKKRKTDFDFFFYF